MTNTLRRSAAAVAAFALLSAAWLIPGMLPMNGQNLWWVPYSFAAAGFLTVVIAIAVRDLSQLPLQPVPRWLVVLLIGSAAAAPVYLIEHEPTVVTSALVALNAAGSAICAVALFALALHAARRRVDWHRTSLRRWVLACAAALALAPPYLLGFKIAELLSCLVAVWTLLTLEVPPLEESFRPARKWLLRAAMIAAGALGLAVPDAWAAGITGESVALMHFDAIVVATLSAMVAVPACLSAADALGFVAQRARSLRTSMLLLALSSAALGFGVSALDVPVHLNGVRDPTLSLLGKSAVVGLLVWAFCVGVARRLSRALQRSIAALADVRQGNLDVTLEVAGRDELAEVASSFNDMVAQLREAEFLERMNADLQARSAQLVQTLEALRTAQADLVRSERMASVAAMVKGIAHELNNPIGFIAGNMPPLKRYCGFLAEVAARLADGAPKSPAQLAELTRLSPSKDLSFVASDLSRLTDDVSEGARRAQLIISDLQSLTSAAQRGVEQVDVHRAVRQTLVLLKPRLPAGVHVEADLRPVPSLTARAGQLEQVLVNLVDNAARAVSANGTIRVAVDVAKGGAQLALSVADDGVGMAPEVQQHALEPFFTTRGPGEGSGLGLAIVASIVRGHHGVLSLESAPQRGTCVRIELPLRGEVLLAAEAARPVVP